MEEEKGIQVTGKRPCFPCDPNRWLYKYFILILVCCFRFGYDFCFNQPLALEKIIEDTLNITTAQYSLIYTFYSWPKVITSFVGGVLLDRYLGLRWGTLLLVSILLIGQIVFTFGAYIESVWVMYLGRFFFGCGAGSLLTAQNGFLVVWFQGKVLSFVFGLKLSLGRVSSIISVIGNPIIKNNLSRIYSDSKLLSMVFLVGVVACIFSLFAVILIGFLHRRAEIILKKSLQEKAKKLNYKDIAKFGIPYWLICGMIACYYTAVFPFNSLAMKFFIVEYGVSEADASFTASLIYLVPAFLSPLAGFLVDKTGKNLFWVLGGASLNFAGHLLMGITRWNPKFPMVLLGISLAVVASGGWPLISFVIPKHQIGTAYGLTFSIQAIGLGLGNYFGGLIVDKFGYFWTQMFFVGWASGTCTFAILLTLYNFKKGGRLNLTTRQREEIKKKEEELNAQIELKDEEKKLNA